MNLEDDILIERFLRDELSKEEKRNFLQRVDVDESFREYYIFEKQLFETLNNDEWSFVDAIESKEIEQYTEVFEEEETQQLKEIIEKVSVDYNTKKPNKVIPLIATLAAIAAILVITFTVFLKSPIDNNKLYAENIALNELTSSLTRGNENSDDLLEAEVLFKKGKYQECLTFFNKVRIKEKNNSSVYIYEAIAYIELKRYKEGEVTLDKLINSDLIDAEKGYWYKSLLYLKSDQIEKAKKSLKTIIDNSYFKKEKAKGLLGEL